MIKFLLLPLVFLLFLSTASAQDWYASLQSGNIHVYVTNYDSSRIIVTEFPNYGAYIRTLEASDSVSAKSVLSQFRSTTGSHEVFELLGASQDVFGYWMKWRDPSGIVISFHHQFGINGDTIPQFLAVPPTKDTLLDFTERFGFSCSNFRFLDTLVYGKTLPAFAYTHKTERNVFTVIVARPIGILRIIDQQSADEWYLSSAVIGKDRFNRDTRPRRAPRICNDYTVQYTETNDEQHYSFNTTYSAHDTTINNSDYLFILSENLMDDWWPFYSYGDGKSPIFGYRNDTIVQYTESGDIVLEERPISLGDIITYYNLLDMSPQFMSIVIDTGSVPINGISKGYFTYGHSMADNVFFEIWVEEIGLYTRHIWSYFSGNTILQLTEATNCGEHFIITGMDDPAEATPRTSYLAADLYPNPVSTERGTMTLHFAHPMNQSMHIAISDALGRIVYTSTLPAVSQEEIQIPIRTFNPGIYFLSATAGQLNTTKRFFIVH